MGTPLSIRFADGTERCTRCKGLGLVRGAGTNAGRHYRTLKGAQESMGRGNARDCPDCEGSGIVVIEERVAV